LKPLTGESPSPTVASFVPMQNTSRTADWRYWIEFSSDLPFENPPAARDLAPEWLRKSWESSRQSGLDRLSMDEIDAEIAAARKARREPRSSPG
jgi:hypothetical protein